MAKYSFAAVEERYGFKLPEVYRLLSDAGHLDPRGSDCLTLTDVEWLTPQDIAEYKFLDWQAPHKTWFVPFAISARRDEWGWRLDWAAGGEPPVVFCERGPEGYGYAPDFRGFLYHMLLEELSGTWLLENDEDKRGKQAVARSVEIVSPHLPKHWVARLKALLQKGWHLDKGWICVYPRSECERCSGTGVSTFARTVLAGRAVQTIENCQQAEGRENKVSRGLLSRDIFRRSWFGGDHHRQRQRDAEAVAVGRRIRWARLRFS